MSDKPQTLDEWLGAPSKGQTLDEWLAPPRIEMFGRKSSGEYFQEGFQQGMGKEPFGARARKMMSDAGMLVDATGKDRNIVRSFNEGVVLPAVTAIDAALRTFNGVVYGISTQLTSLGVPEELTPAPYLEAFPVGRFTGMPARIPATVPSLRVDLDAAERLGLFGRPAEEVARQAFDVEQPREFALSGQAAGRLAPAIEAEAQVRPVTPHDVARIAEPDLFVRYDTLQEQRTALTDTLAEMKRDDPQIIALEQEAATILGKVNNVESRLTRRATERLENIRTLIDDAQRVDSPVMAEIRKQRQEIDFALRDIAPEVSQTLRIARDSLRTEETLSITREALLPEQIDIRANPGGGFDVESPRGVFHAADAVEAQKIAQREATTRNVNVLAQRAATIRQTVESDLRAAGRPAGEAQTAASLVAAHYEARGQRLGISPQELFDADFPSIRAGGPSANRGEYSRLTNELRLFDRADASTFVHEMGHRWFAELDADAKRPNAPAELVRDRDTALAWMKEAGETRAQQERFARGFERYLMEGTAPSSRLARVFEQFRDWLTRIYQSVARLRAPINDDIRGVYDRLLSHPNEDPVITTTKEREGFADLSEALAREAPLEAAAEVANTIRGVRENAAELLSPELANARTEAIRGPERINIPEPEGARAGDRATGPSSAERAEALREDGVVPPAKSAEVGPDGTFERVGGRYVDAEGRINLDALLTAEDIGDALKIVVREGAFSQARRGVLSDAETIKLADEMGMRPRDIDRRVVGEAFNAEQITAAIDLYRRSAAQTKQLMERASSGDIEGIKDYAIASERHVLIMEQLAGIRSEAGRSLRALRQLSGIKDVEALDIFFQKAMGRTLQDLKSEAALSGLYIEQAQLARFLRRTRNPKTTWRKIQEGIVEFWLSSIFSGFETQIANIAGNIMPFALHPVELAGANVVGRVRGVQAVELSDVGDFVRGAKAGAWKGVIEAGKVFIDENRIDPRFSGALDHYTRAIPGLAGQVIRFPGLRMLSVGDTFFKSVNYEGALHTTASRIAREEGLTGDALNTRIAEIVAEPSEATRTAARDFSLYQTFQSPLGKYGRSLQRATEEHPLLRLVFPAVRTGIDLLKYSTERTPFGIVMKEARDKLSGTYGRAAQDLQISRMAIGSMVMTGVLTAWFADLMTDGGPTQPEEVETWRAAGRQPYSWKAGEMWVDYRRFSPLGTIFQLTTDLTALGHQIGVAWTKDDEKEWDRARMMVAAGAWRNLGDSLSLRGASDLFEMMSNYQRYGQNYWEKLAASWIPNIIGQATATADPVLRDAQTILDALRIKSGIGREDTAVLRDRWGEPISTYKVLGARILRDNTADPVNAELLRLKVNPARPDRKWDGVKLTPQQYDDYTRTAGRLEKERLNVWVASPAYAQLPDGLKALTISKFVESSREEARRALLIMYPELIDAKVKEKLKVLN